jgi:hypothetical protein
MDENMEENKKMNIIIQTSLPHTGSTVLINILHGFIMKDEPVHHVAHYYNITKRIYNNNENINIFKLHEPNIDDFIEMFSDKYNMYFVTSERGDKVIDEKYHHYKNVLVFNYGELLETETYSIEDMVCNAYDKLRDFLPGDIELNKQDAIERIKKMNIAYEEIKDKPFSYIDHFFELHGSHRKRKC